MGVVSPEHLESEGFIDGIPFHYALGTVNRGTGWAVLSTKARAVAHLLHRLAMAKYREEIDLVWFNNISFYNLQPMTALAKALGIKTIQAYEDEWLEVVAPPTGFSPTGRLFAMNAKLGDRVCASQADAVVAISNFLSEKYRDLVGNKTQVHLVPTVIECSEWACPDEEETSEPIVLHSGAFGDQDQLDLLVQALAILRSRGRAFRLVFLGGNLRNPERTESLKRLIADNGLRGSTEITGFVPLAEVRKWIERSSVLVNLRRESEWSRSGLSTKLSEYLASGRLVVASRLGEVPYYLTDGKDALLVEPNATPEELSVILERALGSRNLRRDIGRAGRKTAQRCFDTMVVSSQLQGIFDGILG